MDRRKAIAIASYAVAALFLLTGIAKFAGGNRVLDQFEGWGYPAWFAYVTGAVEVVLAGLIAFPRTRFFGALGGIPLLLVAAVTHIKEPEIGALPMGLPMLAACVWIAWELRPAAMRAKPVA